MTLSDKINESNKYLHQLDVKYVKEFIKEVKDIIWENIWVKVKIEKIDKLAGSKLI